MCGDPATKVAKTRRFYEDLGEGCLYFSGVTEPVRKIPIPGRPDKPALIDGKQVPRRGLGNAQGRIALLHALAHIEFNAINLALDAVYRFRDMPRQYVDDWARIAYEEACHFGLLSDRLQVMGS
ncbi:MAG: DUF455 family protein, partial [Gammaproteobacteria bacterium]|nr:DUF455 family protein [Gammaproteobacteria bacterium]